MKKLGLYVVFCLLLMTHTISSAKDIGISFAYHKILPVSVEALLDEVKTEKKITGLTVWNVDDAKLIRANLPEIILEAIFQAAATKDGGDEAFFGPSEQFVIKEIESKNAYLLTVEKTGKRFRIAPLEKIAGNCWVQANIAYISKDYQLLSFVNFYQKTIKDFLDK